MNAYFQIFNDNGKISVRFYPATDGGSGILKDEIMEYLSVKNVLYDVKDLANAFTDYTETWVMKTTTPYQYNESEMVKVEIAPDNMSATARILAPFEGGQEMPEFEFMRELTSRGIIGGVDKDGISAFLANRRYCTDFIVATGTPAKQGSDASIEYFFNTDPKVRPTLNEDGSVDFFNLNTINNCKAGDLLAKLTPAVPGIVGMNVKGERIKPRDVRPAMLKFGHNIAINEEKTELRSEVSGHVNLVEGKVFVSNVLEVENVDNSVGNIQYEGNVKVNGNVCENFTVKASGDIEVRGVVEGAFLEAGGNIIIARGMNGMHKGVLKCDGNVISKFIENSTVTASGYVDSESILHSNINAGTEIHVTGKRGFITGGRVCASNSISVKNLGSNMGADTIVEVGMDTSVKQNIIALQKEIQDISKQLDTVRPVLEGAKKKLALGIKLSQDQLLQLQKLALLNKEKTERLTAAMQELKENQEAADSSAGGQVIVTGDVYPGTKICIGDVSMVVKTPMKYCRFIKEAGDVKMAAIY